MFNIKEIGTHVSPAIVHARAQPVPSPGRTISIHPPSFLFLERKSNLKNRTIP